MSFSTCPTTLWLNLAHACKSEAPTMNTTHIMVISYGLFVTALLALVVFTHKCRRQTKSVTAQNIFRMNQIQSLRDVLHRWLVEGAPVDIDGLRHAVAQITELRSCWLECEQSVVTEAQVTELPLIVDPHLANMALHTHKTVHQHQLAQWGWASTYIPVYSHNQPRALLLLACDKNLSVNDHAFSAALAEILCNACSHATQP